MQRYPYARFLIPILALIAVFPLHTATDALTRFADAFSNLTQDRSSILWFDEAATVPPLMSLINNGYTGYRCGAAMRTGCYGSGQSFLDWAVVGALPESWIKQDPNLRLPGHTWPWHVEYPNVARVMRWTRALSATLAVVLIFAAGFRLSWLTGISGVLLVLSSAFFVHSWQGIKNDFPALAWLLIFYWTCAQWLLRGSSRTGFAWAIASFIGGIWALLMKQSSIPLVGAVLGMLLVTQIFSLGMRRAGKQVAIAVTLALLFYLALNPASLMTSYEAKWFSYNPYASYSFSDFDLSKLSRIASFRIEWQMALVAISPLLIALIIASLFWRKCAQLLPLLVGAATGSGVVVVIHLINHFNRPHYYLPVFVGGVFLILKTLEQAVPRRSLAADFSGLALIIAAVVLHQSFFFETPGYSPAAPFRFNHKASSSWWMDIGLRPLISQAFAKENKIAFYDAISESPRDLAQRIGDSNSRVLAPCWSYPEISKDSMNSGSYASPIVNDWAEWARTHCSGFNEYTFNLTAAHHYGFYETLFVDVSAQDFSRVLASPHRIANSQSYFHPRLFKGSIEGIDIWIDHGNAMVFTKDFVLEQQFSFERMPRAVRLTSESTCKKPGELRLVAKQKLNGTPSTQSYAETSISVREPFCKYYSERYGFDICRVPGAVLDQFANWSIRFEPLAPIQVNLQGSGPWELKIAGKLSPGERCWVRVNPIEFIY